MSEEKVKYVQIRLTEAEVDELQKRADINLRNLATEGAMIVKTVLSGRGDDVTVPGVNGLFARAR